MNGPIYFRVALTILMLCGAPSILAAEPLGATPLNLKVPPGFTIELVAGAPLTERPIVASFDDEGRLYVAESSGSNDKVEKQLAELPHRVVRLEDEDGDGRFDKRTVFADRMMFPEGTQFLDGSLYVSAPPSIWKLTDTNDDGVADERVEWFQGKTLTGCANDLHGPYLGPDGWLYWCKGAFAEQTHEVHGREWKTRAAHIFRSHSDGSGLEPVMTGGMDNPVDVVFTPEGERIFSATLVVGSGRRDGIAHAIYGGVYGKEHGVLDGHPRTGELMPVFALMSPTSPCGLERYDSTVFGSEFRGNLFACQFNMRKVSRHVLRPEGSTFACADADFVTSDNVDFHPTDVLMDADGSLLVIDTGGWYKLCCPTSQLWKPDVVGGIYRVRRQGVKSPVDPRGLKVKWSSLTINQLWELHADVRPAVRQRASREIVLRRTTDDARSFFSGVNWRDVVATISKLPKASDAGPCDARTAALARLWTLSQLSENDSRSCIRQLLKHKDASVRLAALNAISLHRDASAYSRVIKLLKSDVPPNRRAAAEVLGRLGNANAVPQLLAAASSGTNDRVLQHSITYALIELADADATRAGLLSGSPGTQAMALVALDQMPGGAIGSQQVIPLLDSRDETLRDAARWLVSRHTEWGGELSQWFRSQLAALPAESTKRDKSEAKTQLESMLVEFAVHTAIQQLVASTLTDSDSASPAKLAALHVIIRSRLPDPPRVWRKALAQLIDRNEHPRLALVAARQLPPVTLPDDELNKALLTIANSPILTQATRNEALAVVATSLHAVSDSQFKSLIGAFSMESSLAERTAAVDALEASPLSSAQLERLCNTIESAGPLELNRLLAPYAKLTDDKLGMELLSSLEVASALPSLRIDVLRTALAKYGPDVQQRINELEDRVNIDAATQRKRIEELLPLMAQGDVRRGHAVYYSAKATCAACHRLGYAGGVVGPELSRIGEVRTERDLLESILYPSLSFVRSYEPVRVVTVDGRTINGTILDETETDYVLATGPDQVVRLARDDVEGIEPSTTSVMPGGLDGQLTVEELADLVAFLKNATGK